MSRENMLSEARPKQFRKKLNISARGAKKVVLNQGGGGHGPFGPPSWIRY